MAGQNLPAGERSGSAIYLSGERARRRFMIIERNEQNPSAPRKSERDSGQPLLNLLLVESAPNALGCTCGNKWSAVLARANKADTRLRVLRVSHSDDDEPNELSQFVSMKHAHVYT